MSEPSAPPRDARLREIFFAFLLIGSTSFGGGVLAYLRSSLVAKHGWLDDKEFVELLSISQTFPQLIHLYSVGQMAPGPNMMMVASIGEWVAGVPGSVAVLLAFFLPTGLLTFGVGRLWVRLEPWPWRASIQQGLAPVSIGLVLAGSISLAEGALTGWLAAVIAAAVFAVLLLSRVNPALLVLCGAVVSLFAFSPR